MVIQDIMVGALAMESVVEDYGHQRAQQECKKSRSDSDDRVVRPRAITSYFTPLRRQQDDAAEAGVTSVPRPADLLGYFPRVERAPSAEGKSGRADGKKVTHAVMKNRDESRRKKDDVEESAKEKRQSEGGRARLSRRKAAALASNGGSSSTNKHVRNSPKLDILLLSDSSSQDTVLKPIEFGVDSALVEMAESVEVKHCSVDTKAVDSSARRTESVEEDSSGAADRSTLNTSLEVNVTSLSSEQEELMTISYEDFIISCQQSEDGIGNAPDAEAAGLCSLLGEGSGAELSAIAGEAVPDVRTPSPATRGASPRLVTVSVEVHSSPEREALATPRESPAKQKRVANIFNLSKKKQPSTDLVSRPTASGRSDLSSRQSKALKGNVTASGTQRFPNKLADDPELKCVASPAPTGAAAHDAVMQECRHSNVAVLVDDELLELDANGFPVVPACSKAERREFMAAFTKSRSDTLKSRGTQHKSVTSPRERLQDEQVSPASDDDAESGHPSKCVDEAVRRLTKKRGRRGGGQIPESEEAATLPAKQDEASKPATNTGRSIVMSPTQQEALSGRGAREKGKAKAQRAVSAGGDAVKVDEQEVETDDKSSAVIMGRKPRKRNETLASVHGADVKERQRLPTRTRRSVTWSEAESRDADVNKKPADSAELLAKSPVIRPRRKCAYALPASVEDAASPKMLRKSQGRRLNFDGEAGEVGTGRRDASALSVYRSELLSAYGPFRLKLTRVVSENVEIGSSDEELFTPCSSKLKKKSKKRIDKVGEEEEKKPETRATLRRSCRQKSSPFVVEDEEDGGVGRREARRRVAPRGPGRRSINDVLGKVAIVKPDRRSHHAIAQGNAASIAPFGKKSARVQLSQGDGICVMVERSSECSEESSDGEASRSRREFLKSGLPDRLLRQRAREAATLDAYATAFEAFPTTTHVQQKEPDCELWSLPFPTSTLLRTLAGHAETPTVHAGMLVGRLPALRLGLFTWAKRLAARDLVRHESGTRSPLATAARQALLADVKAAHPKFPARRFLAQMQMRHTTATSTNSDGGTVGATKELAIVVTGGSMQRKRKADGGSGAGAQRPKKCRGDADPQTHADEQEVVVINDDGKGEPPAAAKEGSSLRRRRGRASGTALLQEEGRTDCGKSLREAAQASEDLLGEVCDDLLWTEKYQPRSKDEIIGNSAAVRKLHGWLKEWKSRADREAERASRREKTESQVKMFKGSGSESDFQSESGDDESSSSEDEDSLCHGMLLTGPPGVGKTAAVYACAQELGFKVFEVNCSSQRSGRHILAQLREATQSHQVSKQRAGGQGSVLRAPATASSSAAGDSRPASKQQGASARHASPVKVLRSPRKRPVSPRSSAASTKNKQLPAAFVNFFKIHSGKRSGDSDKEPATKKPSREPKQNKRAEGTPVEVEVQQSAAGSVPAGSQSRKHTAATSLILFEEVDVVFDDDTGFLSAIRTFMATTKRPIVLITSDPTFYLTFDGHYEQIHFKTPSMASVVPYLQVACLAEGLRVSVADVEALLAHTRGDVRRALLSLQLWACSGGAALGEAQPQPPYERDESEGVGCEAVLPQAAQGETHCSESLLGLSELLGSHGSLYTLLTEAESGGSLARQIHALTETQRLGLDFVRCNWELLLPLLVARCPSVPTPLSGAPPAAVTPVPEGNMQSKLGPEYEDDSSPVKAPRLGRSRQRRRGLLFFDSDVYDSEESSRDAASTPQNQNASNVDSEIRNGAAESCGAQRRMQTRQRGPAGTDGGERANSIDGAESGCRVGPVVRPRSDEERRAARAGLHCLDAVSQLANAFSCTDYRLAQRDGEAEGPCGASLLDWWPAQCRSGLLDASRIGGWDTGADMRDGVGSEIRAAVEALALRRCRSEISLALESPDLGPEVRQSLSLQVPEGKEASRFLPESLEVSRASEERRALAQLVAPGCVALSSLCARRAVAIDYLPVLRQLCRTERLREDTHSKRRFHHYLEDKLELSRSTFAALSADFP
ncbi:ATPase family AAA domain-containing protein 5 isoform X1 [Petromyzon marinus]|uniref:ATPase family AAA domain-containing protein 5 isoform X1 n=2 Tax=Petromyzon marinus TaxID=7757 RepID=UPI003F6F9EEC